MIFFMITVVLKTWFCLLASYLNHCDIKSFRLEGNFLILKKGQQLAKHRVLGLQEESMRCSYILKVD